MRPLSPEEERLWSKVVESVRPYRPQPVRTPHAAPGVPPEPARRPVAIPPPPQSVARKDASTLNGSWDRRLGRGLVAPDIVLDLHGHNLAAAYGLIDSTLEAATADGVRVLLLITGKPPAAGRPAGRGRIRAAVGDWLAASRHSGRIAAVRAAHPRHGGAGALYIVIRRNR